MEGGHEMQALDGGNPKRLLPGCVEVSAELDEARAEGGDRRILIRGVALGDIDGRGYARASGRECNGLAVIAPRRRDHPGNPRLGSAQSVQIDDTPTHLES